MPPAGRWLIRASLVYLAVGFTLGALLLVNKGVPFAPVVWRLLPVHVEFLLVGWVVQLTMGVAIWIFPRFGVPRSARGSQTATWLAFGLLNAGVWLAGVGALFAGKLGGVLPPLGRLAELAAAFVFAAGIWARVRGSGLSPM